MAGAQGLLPAQAALHNFWLPGRANKFVFLVKMSMIVYTLRTTERHLKETLWPVERGTRSTPSLVP